MRWLVPLALALVTGCTPPPERASEDTRPNTDTRPTVAAVSEPEPRPSGSSVDPVQRPPQASVPAAPAGQLEPASGGFELLEAGAEPLVPLRFSPTAGRIDEVALTMAMTVALSGTAMPPVRQVLPPLEQITRVETVTIADGRITQRWVYEPIQTTDARASTGFEQTVVASDRGARIESRVSFAEGTDPKLSKSLETLARTVEQLLVEFPTEAVGVGAEWKVTGPVALASSGALALEQTSLVRLVARDGRRVTLDVQLSQRPLTDTFVTPDDTQLDIVEFDSRGASQIVYDLDAMLPISVAAKLDTTFAAATQTEPTQQLTFEVGVELTLRAP